MNKNEAYKKAIIEMTEKTKSEWILIRIYKVVMYLYIYKEER